MIKTNNNDDIILDNNSYFFSIPFLKFSFNLSPPVVLSTISPMKSFLMNLTQTVTGFGITVV